MNVICTPGRIKVLPIGGSEMIIIVALVLVVLAGLFLGYQFALWVRGI